MLEGKDKNISEQIEILTKILEQSPTIMAILIDSDNLEDKNWIYRETHNQLTIVDEPKKK